jgi:hypothetical protein
MDHMARQLMNKTRQTPRTHNNKVEALVVALLDEERVAGILDERAGRGGEIKDERERRAHPARQ